MWHFRREFSRLISRNFLKATKYTQRSICLAQENNTSPTQSSEIFMEENLWANIKMPSSSLKNELVHTFLELETLDVNLFRAHHLMQVGSTLNPFVYGGQVIGQALMAASSTVPDMYHPHSLHSYFIKAGNVKKPIVYSVDRVRDGRSFCTRFVKAVQNGEPICTSEISYHKEEPDSIVHQVPMPSVAPPESLTDAETLIRQKLTATHLSPEMRQFLERRLANLPTTFDVRPVDADAYLRLKPAPPHFFIWVKSRGTIGDDVRLHHCVAAYISDSSMIGTALLPHVGAGFRPAMVFSLDHSIWIHRYRFRVDEWMLYETESHVAAASRALIYGKLWTRDGTIAVSTAQEGLIRAPRSKL